MPDRAPTKPGEIKQTSHAARNLLPYSATSTCARTRTPLASYRPKKKKKKTGILCPALSPAHVQRASGSHPHMIGDLGSESHPHMLEDLLEEGGLGRCMRV